MSGAPERERARTRTTRSTQLAALAWAGLVAGCFNPQPPAGVPCGANGSCPSGLACIQDRCLVPGTLIDPDAQPDGHPIPIDAAEDAAIDAPPDAFVDASLVAHWKFDDAPENGAFDSSGRGHTAACVGACPMVVAGKHGNGYRFDDALDHALLVPDHPDFRGPFTIAAWMLADRVDRSQAILSKPHGTGNGNSWQLEIVGASSLLSFSGGSPHSLDSTSITVPGTWYHVAGAWDGATKRLYVNGALVATRVSEILYDNYPIVLGGDVNTGVPALHWDGILDDLRIYNRALSLAEIQALAN